MCEKKIDAKYPKDNGKYIINEVVLLKRHRSQRYFEESQ